MRQFFQELKRRKVFKTLGVYAAAALIIIQVADIVFPRLLLPDWTVTLIVVLVIIGFPITFFLSWNYDITHDKHKQSEENSENPPAAKESSSGDKTNINIYTITGAVLACVGIGFWFFFSTSSLTSADDNFIENSIAVFSFEDRSLENKNSNIGLILQDLIISDLSGLTRLKVISSQRLFEIEKQMGENKEDKYSISQMANAKVLLSGSIMELSGKKILVSQLIDVLDGNVIISRRIEGTDIYSMVDELTAYIHEDLGITSYEDDEIALDCGEKTSQSLDAYEKYLEGLKYFNELSYESANVKFQEAIKIDSTFFDAHYLSLISLAWLDDSNDNNESVENCQSIIDNKIYKDGDQKLKIESLCLYLNKDFEKAQIIYEKLVEDDPDDRLSWYSLGEIYYHRDENDFNKADSAFKKALALDPDFRVARIHIMDILYMAGDFHKLIAEETKELENGIINKEIFENLLRAYEVLEDSLNAESIKEQAKSSLTKNELCGLYVKTGKILGYKWNVGLKNQTPYHIRRAIQYFEDGQNICAENGEDISLWNKYAPIIESIILSYKVYDENYVKRMYNKQINLINDRYEKMIFNYRLGGMMLWKSNRRPTGDDNKDLPIIIDYLKIALDDSKKLKDEKYFSKIMSNLIGPLKNQNNPEFSLLFFNNQIVDFCGSINMVKCLKPAGSMALNELGNAFYNIGNYQYATMVYQHLTDQSNLFNFEDEKTTAHQHIFYYRLGIMTLKQNDYFTARQHFISAFSALNKNKTIIDKFFSNQNWMTASVINHRIGECYYKETNYENAIKYYKEAYKAESNNEWYNEKKMELLNQIAYSEYLNGQSDSSTVHFQQVEKYYNEDKINYKDGTLYYYIDWPLYLYHKSNDNTTKAQQYLTDAYNHISEDVRNEYLEDDNRLENLHQYYYIHEIIETYNQNIR